MISGGVEEALDFLWVSRDLRQLASDIPCWARWAQEEQWELREAMEGNDLSSEHC